MILESGNSPTVTSVASIAGTPMTMMSACVLDSHTSTGILVTAFL